MMNPTKVACAMLCILSGIGLYGAKPKRYMSAAAEAAEPAMSGSHFNCPEIESTDDLKIRPDVPLVITFFGDHCSACKDLKDPLNDFIQNNKDVDFISINANNPEVQDIVSIFEIQQVPSIVVLHKHISAGVAKEFLERATGKNVGMAMMETTTSESVGLDGDEEEATTVTMRQTSMPLSVTPEDIAPVNLPEDMDGAKNSKNAKKYGAKSTSSNGKKSSRYSKRSSRRS